MRALVTGATGTIGTALAEAFARTGYDLALSATNASKLDALSRDLRDAGGHVLAVPADLADPEAPSRLVDAVSTAFGGLDVLINNAAWRERVTMRQISTASWDRTIRVCLTAPAFLARAAAVLMERQGRGVIINITSVQSDQVPGFSPAYVAAKGGLDALTYELATLYGPAGVRVVALAPGAVQPGGEAPASPADYSLDAIPLRRAAKPSEVAAVAVWVAGDEASYVTGTRIVVDGGWTHQQSPYSYKATILPGEFR